MEESIKQIKTFKLLNNRILQEGVCLDGGVLKVDVFINHQIDPYLMKQVSIEFIRRFADLKINKILTVEASGIAPAVMLGYLMELPVVFAKKRKPSTMNDMYQTVVHSFTKNEDSALVVSKDYLTEKDHVLFVDDFLAFGSAGCGIVDLCRQAGATVEGMGFIIEKEFQHGREALKRAGVTRIESLAIVESLEGNHIKFKGI